MAERILRRQPRIIPTSPDLAEPAGQDPTSPQDQEGLAQIAFLAGISPSNTSVARYMNALSNTAYANTLKGASQ